jgi:hypothetical protein
MHALVPLGTHLSNQVFPGAIRCEPKRVARGGRVQALRDLLLFAFPLEPSDGRLTVRCFLSTC